MSKPTPITVEELTTLRNKQEKQFLFGYCGLAFMLLSFIFIGEITRELGYATTGMILFLGIFYLLVYPNISNYRNLYKEIDLEQLKELEKYAGDPDLIEYLESLSTMNRTLFNQEFKVLHYYLEEKLQESERLKVFNSLKNSAKLE